MARAMRAQGDAAIALLGRSTPRAARQMRARADFEARLGCARPRNGQQYLRIKALALRDDGQIRASKALFRRVIDEPGYDHEVAFAEEMLGDLAAREGDRDLAERHYRRVLAGHRSMNGTTGTVQISLAELLLDTGHEADRDEALALLNSWIADTGRIKFDSQLFRKHLALICAAEQTGDQETARARAAASRAWREKTSPAWRPRLTRCGRRCQSCGTSSSPAALSRRPSCM